MIQFLIFNSEDLERTEYNKNGSVQVTMKGKFNHTNVVMIEWGDLVCELLGFADKKLMMNHLKKRLKGEI